ncbi:MAG: GDYXXLXY domain-containing protein [Rhodopirellula sp.]|nr:GDYXXLXY domain-containing protein [Rhodopirellula sp.]
MKTPTLIVTSLLVLASLNFLIIAKERVLLNGRSVLCKLAPRDPRSLMQGDYMVLRYEIAETASSKIPEEHYGGLLVLRLDKDDVAQFQRLDDGSPLAANEVRIRFRRRQNSFRRGVIRLGAESYFFQEGRADDFAKATYGELKVAPSGESILIGLRDENLKRL